MNIRPKNQTAIHDQGQDLIYGNAEQFQERKLCASTIVPLRNTEPRL